MTRFNVKIGRTGKTTLAADERKLTKHDPEFFEERVGHRAHVIQVMDAAGNVIPGALGSVLDRDARLTARQMVKRYDKKRFDLAGRTYALYETEPDVHDPSRWTLLGHGVVRGGLLGPVELVGKAGRFAMSTASATERGEGRKGGWPLGWGFDRGVHAKRGGQKA